MLIEQEGSESAFRSLKALVETLPWWGFIIAIMSVLILEALTVYVAHGLTAPLVHHKQPEALINTTTYAWEDRERPYNFEFEHVSPEVAWVNVSAIVQLNGTKENASVIETKTLKWNVTIVGDSDIIGSHIVEKRINLYERSQNVSFVSVPVQNYSNIYYDISRLDGFHNETGHTRLVVTMRDPNRYPLITLVPGVTFSQRKTRWYLFASSCVVLALCLTMFYWGHFYGYTFYTFWSIEQKTAVCISISLLIMNLPFLQTPGTFGVIACVGQFVAVHLALLINYIRCLACTPTKPNPDVDARRRKYRNIYRRAVTLIVCIFLNLGSAAATVYTGFFIWESTPGAGARYFVCLAAANWVTYMNVILVLPAAILFRVDHISKAEQIELEQLTLEYGYREDEFVT
mmetsp:Transcript_26754/g.29830  ORF Transcript_26754/g.29830 Transcript_26754/m.29830 type:complete len:402 (+) Transcript_26754:87-1292(+)